MAQRATWHPAGLLGSRRGGGPSGDSKGCARCIAGRAGNAGASLSIGDRRDRTQLGRSFGRAQLAYARCDPRCHSSRYGRRFAGLRHLRPASPSDRRGTRSAGGESRGLKPQSPRVRKASTTPRHRAARGVSIFIRRLAPVDVPADIASCLSGGALCLIRFEPHRCRPHRPWNGIPP